MRTRRPLVRRILALALVTLGALVVACPGAQQKEDDTQPLGVKLRRVEVADASFEKLGLLVIVAVQNPTSSSLSLVGGDASLAIDGRASLVDAADEASDEEEASEEEGETADEDDASEDDASEVASSDDAEEDEEEDADDDAAADDVDTTGIVTGERYSGDAPGGSLEAFKETEVPIRVEVALPKDASVLERLLSWSRMSVDVKGTLRIGGRTETFAGKREVATPILPKVVLQEAQVASVDGGLKGAVFFSVGIDNPNTFPIEVDRFGWSATVGGKELRKAGDASRERVPPSSVAAFEDTLQLDEETYGPDVRKLLSQQRVPYRIEGFFEIRGIRRAFAFEGEMEFAR